MASRLIDPEPRQFEGKATYPPWNLDAPIGLRSRVNEPRGGKGTVAKVMTLKWDDQVQVDGNVVGDLVVELGPTAAWDVVGDAVGAVRADLALLRLAMAEGRLADVVRLGDVVSRVAWEIGLTTLSAVAVDLALCAERGDMAALPAVHARLQRVAGRSLTAASEESAIG